MGEKQERVGIEKGLELKDWLGNCVRRQVVGGNRKPTRGEERKYEGGKITDKV